MDAIADDHECTEWMSVIGATDGMAMVPVDEFFQNQRENNSPKDKAEGKNGIRRFFHGFRQQVQKYVCKERAGCKTDKREQKFLQKIFLKREEEYATKRYEAYEENANKD